MISVCDSAVFNFRNFVDNHTLAGLHNDGAPLPP
jgi:hypothetical protein